LAKLLKKECGWDIGPENIALTTGSQASFFYLFNMFCGQMPDGSFRRMLLPLAPEYVGYADAGLHEGLFLSWKPRIEELGEKLFKYHVEFPADGLPGDIGAICASRPTNPTGNVLGNDELERIYALAKEANVPFILDNAYGLPFPGIIYEASAKPFYRPGMILCMSLSKFGLPGTRTGIVVAPPETIAAIAAFNAILCLAPNGIGAALARELVVSGRIIELSKTLVKPHYQRKAEAAVERLSKGLAGLPARIHKPEGAFFLWLWLKDFPVGAAEFYERLKKRGVIVVPGHNFFPGLQGEWKHKDECVRISYSQNDETVAAGLDIIADEARKIYSQAKVR
jgi:valine--pyruvate aminotransferase